MAVNTPAGKVNSQNNRETAAYVNFFAKDIYLMTSKFVNSQFQLVCNKYSKR